jgi:hypothetical protein
MASELMKVALKPTCSNTEVKLIDGFITGSSADVDVVVSYLDQTL